MIVTDAPGSKVPVAERERLKRGTMLVPGRSPLDAIGARSRCSEKLGALSMSGPSMSEHPNITMANATATPKPASCGIRVPSSLKGGHSGHREDVSQTVRVVSQHHATSSRVGVRALVWMAYTGRFGTFRGDREGQLLRCARPALRIIRFLGGGT